MAVGTDRALRRLCTICRQVQRKRTVATLRVDGDGLSLKVADAEVASANYHTDMQVRAMMKLSRLMLHLCMSETRWYHWSLS